MAPEQACFIPDGYFQLKRNGAENEVPIRDTRFVKLATFFLRHTKGADTKGEQRDVRQDVVAKEIVLE